MSSPTLDERTVTSLVADAIAAPSMHNAQPWRFHFAPRSRTFTLFADLDRAMPHTDPTTRGLHVGCAAALLNLRVAVTHHGWQPTTTLLPDPGTPHLLATVRLDPAPPEGRPGPAAELGDLYPAIHDRHTSRFPFADQKMPPYLRDALVQAARHEGAALTFPAEQHLGNVLDLIRDAEGYNRMDDDRDAETRRWTRDSKTAAPADGIPDYAFGPRGGGGAAATRDFAGRSTLPGRPVANFEGHPQLALLSTEGDESADWLHAGQALERVLLLATRRGLVAAFATQALEWPDLRWLLREPVSGTGHVQMVIRLGYGPRGPRTPRRPVRDVLTIGD
ncbi:Acg family FMN-binding oxidoreductase [Streptomyces jumonjinensis]|uniref:Acg family FMN-binding oxidoreductase n=1 Tax=Streptomyces jumonjinensis TaxID=1945 RepID=UPI003795C2BA